jgi:hypothetical protein
VHAFTWIKQRIGRRQVSDRWGIRAGRDGHRRGGVRVGRRRGRGAWSAARRMPLWLACGLALFMTTVVTGFAGPNRAMADSLRISAVVGFNGYYSKDRPVPVEVHIVNPGAAATGRLSVYVHRALDNDRLLDGNLVWTVKLPAHGALDKRIVVPGEVISAGAGVQCQVGSRLVSTTLNGNPFGRVALVAVVADSAQAAQFLTGSSNGQNGQPVLPVRVNPASLPDSAYLLEDLTAVALSPEGLDELTPRQRSALLMWVKLGGLLLVTGSGTVDPSWQGELPLRPSRPERSAATPLSSFIGGSVAAPAGELEVAGRLMGEDVDVWAGSREKPLVAAKHVGRGVVVQTAFSPLQPTVLGWPGNAALWTTVLKRGSEQSEPALPALTGNGGALDLTTASDALPPLRVPSLRVWSSLFLGYALVIGPLLFLGLRRYKRESWAWVALPVISLVTTVGIYGFGAAQRPNGVLTEGVGVLELVGDGSAEAYGMRGFMSPLVTSATMTASGATFGLPLAETNVRMLGTADVVEDGGIQADFSAIGRWGVRYLYAIGTVGRQGQLEANLDVSLGTVTGMVTNQTPYSLNDVALIWNHQLYELGNLRPGQSVIVDDGTKTISLDSNWVSAYGRYNSDITHGVGRALATLLAADAAGSTAAAGTGTLTKQAMLVATCTSETPAIPALHTLQKVASEQKLTVVRQYVETNPVFATDRVVSS